jgi:hypothetical protein
MRVKRKVCATDLSGSTGLGVLRIARISRGRGGSSPMSPKCFAHLSLPKAISTRIILFHKTSLLERRFQFLLTRRHVLTTLLVKKENIENKTMFSGITFRGSNREQVVLASAFPKTRPDIGKKNTVDYFNFNSINF